VVSQLFEHADGERLIDAVVFGQKQPQAISIGLRRRMGPLHFGGRLDIKCLKDGILEGGTSRRFGDLAGYSQALVTSLVI